MSVKQTINTNSGVSTTTRPGLVFYNDRITGIVTFVDADDVSTKNYVDNTPGFIVPTVADEGKFLTTTDGVNQSFEEISNYQEYTTPGSYTFNLPPYANLLYVQAINGGDGGSTGRNSGDSLVLDDISDAGLSFTGSSSSSSAVVISDEYYLIASGYSSKLFVSTDGVFWTARTHGHPANNSARLLSYANGLYYYTSDLKCTFSTDTIVWSDVVYTNDFDIPYRFLYVPENNLYIMNTTLRGIHTSTDGTVWVARTSGVLDDGGDLLYHNGIYLGGMGEELLASTDTIHWAARTTSMSLVVGDDKVHLTKKPNSNLVVATHSSSIAVSTDTVIWTLRTFTGTSSRSITSSKELYVIGSSGTPATYHKSTDSITWVSFILNDQNEGTALSGDVEVSFGKNAFLFIAPNSSGTERFVVNIAKTKYSGSSGGSSDYSEWYLNKNILYSDLTIDVGTGGIGATTVDTSGQVGSATTISWIGPNNSSYKVSPSSSISLSGNSVYSSQGSLSSTYVFDDNSNGLNGNNQTNKNQSTGGGSGALESGIGGSGGEIYDFGFGEKASGGYGFAPSELDGQDAVLNSTLPYGGGGGGGSISAGYSWTLRTSGKSLNASFYSSVIGNGYYILGSQNFILSSTDTIVWEQQNEGGVFNIYGLAKSPEFFLAAGGPNGYVSTSTNAVVWILRTAGFTDIVRQAIYDDNQFIISGDNAFLAVSTDAAHWTKRTTGVSITEPIKGLGYANGYYFIGYSNATPSVSTDTITWIKRTARVDSYESFGYQNGYYVMTDGGADVISSTDTVIWISRTTGNVSGGIGNNNLGVTPTGFIIQGRGADQWYSISTDSITWTVRTSNSSVIKTVRSITYGDGYALVGGSDGFVEVSPVYIGSGGDGVRGGGGGGGAVGFGTFGAGGNGGDGYVKITWW